MLITIFDVLGIVGASLAIYAFWHLQWRRNYARHMSFSVLNFLASVLITPTFVWIGNPIGVVASMAWGIVSFYGIYRCSNYIRKDMASAKANLARATKVRTSKHS